MCDCQLYNHTFSNMDTCNKDFHLLPISDSQCREWGTDGRRNVLTWLEKKRGNTLCQVLGHFSLLSLLAVPVTLTHCSVFQKLQKWLFWPKFHMHFSCRMLHAPPISASLIIITLIIFGEVYSYEATHLCSLLRPPATCSHIPSIYVLPLVWETKFHIQNSNYNFVHFNLYGFREEMGRQKTVNIMVPSIPWI